jgi:ribose 5-phosphate isomerase B
MEIIALGADHRGFELKTKLGLYLRENGFMPLDVGTHSDERCDALDFAVAAAQAIKEGKAKRSILMCGSANMIAIVANRFQHMRAAVCPHPTAARMARLHNDANALCIAADFMGYDLIKDTVDAYLKTEPLGGRYAERIERLNKLNPNAY